MINNIPAGKSDYNSLQARLAMRYSNGMTFNRRFPLRLKTGLEENLVLKEQWELNENDSNLEEVELRVLTATDRPRPGINGG